MQSILILTFMTAVFAESIICIEFYFDCSKLQFWERDKVQCNASTPVFQCAWDIFSKQYEMKCVRKPILIRIGSRPTIQGGLHYGPCSKDRYQPFHIVSNRTVDCWYLKNRCTEEGQVLCDNRNGDLDRTCRCDYTKSYAFVQSPKNNFSCIPSEEDCSCYKKVCSNETYRLNPEFECVESYNRSDFYDMCLISNGSKSPAKFPIRPWSIQQVKSASDPHIYGLDAGRSIMVYVLIYFFAVLVILVFSPSVVTKGKERQEVRVGDLAVVDFKIYGFAIFQNIKLEKDGARVDSSLPKYKLRKSNNTYFFHTCELEIKDVCQEDGGIYECIVSNVAARLGLINSWKKQYKLTVVPYEGSPIIHNTKQLIDGHISDDSYYTTAAVEQAMEILRKYSTLVVVGHEGTGKSTLCLEIAMRHGRDGFTALIFSPSDLKNVNNCIISNQSQICILDVNIKANSIDQTTKDVLNKCIAYSNNTNHKFIFTVLTTYQTNEFYLEMFEKKKHLNLVKFLSHNDKIGILEKHMVKNKVRKCNNAYESNYEDPEVIDDSKKTVKIYKKILDTIVETDTFVGFPIACKKFFSNRALLHLEHRYFNTPSKSIISDINLYRYKQSLFENRKYIILVYIMMEKQLDLSGIKNETMEMLLEKFQISPDNMKTHHVKDSANDLVATVLNCSHEIYTFYHPTLSKAVWMSYIDVDTDYCVLNCDWDFVDDYIRPKSWPLHETDVCTKIDVSYIISRLQHEIRNGSAWSVCQYLMKFIKFGKEVIENFCQQYSEGKYTIDSSLYLCNAFSKFGSTFEMFEHFPAAIEMLLLSGIDRYENCLLHYCVLQDYEGMLINLPNSFIDTYMSVLNINKYSPFHLEVYLGRQEMFKKHMPHVDRTYENYTKLNRLYHKGERHFGKTIEEKHLNYIGKMNLHSDVLQSSHFGSKKDFFSIRDMLMSFKKASMLMVRIQNLPPTVADSEIEKVLESFNCKIIKQYRERHRLKGRITNVETGDRIVICKPFSILLPNQIRILQYDAKVLHDGQPSENNVKADCSQPDGKTS